MDNLAFNNTRTTNSINVHGGQRVSVYGWDSSDSFQVSLEQMPGDRGLNRYNLEIVSILDGNWIQDSYSFTDIGERTVLSIGKSGKIVRKGSRTIDDVHVRDFMGRRDAHLIIRLLIESGLPSHLDGVLDKIAY